MQSTRPHWIIVGIVFFTALTGVLTNIVTSPLADVLRRYDWVIWVCGILLFVSVAAAIVLSVVQAAAHHAATSSPAGPLTEVTKSRDDANLPADRLFQLTPLQGPGLNICSREERRPGNFTEKFFVRVKFRLWAKHTVTILNVNLEYGKYNLPSSQEIWFHGELMSSQFSYRLKNPKQIEAGTVAVIYIQRDFECKFGHLQEYNTVVITIEATSPAWLGIRELSARGELASGGELRNLELKWGKGDA